MMMTVLLTFPMLIFIIKSTVESRVININAVITLSAAGEPLTHESKLIKHILLHASQDCAISYVSSIFSTVAIVKSAK